MSDANPSPKGPGSEPGAGLLHLVCEGSQEAWDRLVELCAPLVYTWCRRIGLREDDAVDAGQEVFRALALQVGDFRRSRDGPFRGWLRALARRAIDDYLGRAATLVATGGSPEEMRVLPAVSGDSQDAEVDRDREEATLLYRRALELIRGEFPEDVWRAFWAVVVEGRPPAEAAGTLGLTHKEVHRARARVRRRLLDEFAAILEP